MRLALLWRKSAQKSKDYTEHDFYSGFLSGLKGSYETHLSWRNSVWQGHLKDEYRVWDIRATIDNDEWDAMIWMTHNTPIGALILSDRTHFMSESGRYNLSRFFGYSALAGRQFFLEGYEFSNGIPMNQLEERKAEVVAAYNSSGRGLADFMRRRDITYAIISKRFSEPRHRTDLNIVFSNQSVDIVQSTMQ